MFDDIEFNIKEYAIGGKMVTGKCLVSDSQYMSISIPDKELKVAAPEKNFESSDPAPENKKLEKRV